jgi:ADP-heptose:LPS heptosyltransferase
VASLAPLADLPGVAWFSLQLGRLEVPPLPNLISLAPFLENFSDTAYALSGMDLLITVDTAVAHLAGALGIPTLLLLPFQPDFRWLLERDDSPWYPTLRLYRQPAYGDWESVIRQVVTDLTQES